MCVLGCFLDKRKNFNSKYYFLILIILVFFTGLRDGELVTDYSSYEYMFNSDSNLVEPTFIFLRFIVRRFFENSIVFLFLIYAILSLSLKFVVIKDLSHFVFASLVVFVGDLFLQQDFTQVRVAVATSMLLLCIKPLYERDLPRFIIYATIALLFHVSAILLFLLWFLNPKVIHKKWLVFYVLLGYLFAICKLDVISILGYIPIGYIQDKYLLYKTTQEAGDYVTNIFSILYLFKLTFFFVLLWNAEFIVKKNRYAYLILKIFSVSIVSLTLFSQNMAAGLRISEFFGIVNIILFPMLLYMLKPAFLTKLLLCIIFGGILWMRIFYTNLILPG